MRCFHNARSNRPLFCRFGRDWKQIVTYIGTRSVSQVTVVRNIAVCGDLPVQDCCDWLELRILEPCQACLADYEPAVRASCNSSFVFRPTEHPHCFCWPYYAVAYATTAATVPLQAAFTDYVAVRRFEAMLRSISYALKRKAWEM